jgi:hypothetical protein
VYRPRTPPITLAGFNAYLGGPHGEAVLAIAGADGGVRGVEWARYDGYGDEHRGVIVLGAQSVSRAVPS